MSDLNNEDWGGMTSIGKIIRDAWVFDLLPETKDCTGWNLGRLDALLQEVNAEWGKYACLVSRLPKELRERHTRIHGAAFDKAKTAGWSGENETDDENYIETPE
ncbi:MAG: hypothetical protein GXP14_00930 [Gammaproteobacteria bacterium]|nr:hypothetical protein [Gammaproteobacteria bacterium]